MKIKPSDVNTLLEKIPENIRVFLLYGPDSGVAEEHLQKILKQFVADPKDPFIVDRFIGHEIHTPVSD